MIAGDRPPFEELRAAREERGEAACCGAACRVLVVADFFELGALGVERNAVALQIDVDALRAVRGALARRLAAVAERPAALDARAGETGCGGACSDDEREHDRQQTAPSVIGLRALSSGSNHA